MNNKLNQLLTLLRTIRTDLDTYQYSLIGHRQSGGRLENPSALPVATASFIIRMLITINLIPRNSNSNSTSNLNSNLSHLKERRLPDLNYFYHRVEDWMRRQEVLWQLGLVITSEFLPAAANALRDASYKHLLLLALSQRSQKMSVCWYRIRREK